MSTTAAAVYRLDNGKLDVVMLIAKDDDALLREARHQGYLKGATAIAVTFAPKGDRKVHYTRSEDNKFLEVEKKEDADGGVRKS